MTRNSNNRIGAVLLCAALLAGLPFFVACGGGHAKEVQQQAQVVQVRVTDHQLEMPNPLPTGPTRLEITNAGTHEHSFGLTGPAGEQTLEKPLKPGETASMELYLDIGTYRAYCPVDASHGDSMQVALNVVPEASSKS
jgi:hypothetical protein